MMDSSSFAITYNALPFPHVRTAVPGGSPVPGFSGVVERIALYLLESISGISLLLCLMIEKNEKPVFSKEELLHNPESFAAFYDYYRPRVFSFLVSRVHSVADAEDLTAETFEKALRKLESFREDKAAISTWLFTIANNASIDHFRREKRRSGIDPETLAVTYQTDMMSEADRCRLQVIISRMQLLPESQRVVIALKFLEGFKNPDIAEILGCSGRTLSTRIYRSMKSLTRLIASAEDELRLCDE